MSDMPDTIMARPMMGAEPQGKTHTSGPWSLDDPYGNAVKYCRADLPPTREALAHIVKPLVWFSVIKPYRKDGLLYEAKVDLDLWVPCYEIGCEEGKWWAFCEDTQEEADLPENTEKAAREWVEADYVSKMISAFNLGDG